MCGIAGIYRRGGAAVSPEILRAMATDLAHRGPDDEGTLLDGNLGLVFRRLAIIDLTPAANQPMPNEDGSLWLIFNGEIYNYRELRPALEMKGHRFRSHGDAEVIIHAFEEFGQDCVHKFNGMFAFAIWDKKQRALFIARDRVGVKPLYYVDTPLQFGFASEIKALLNLPGIPRRANPRAIADFVELSFPTGTETWFQEVKRLEPGAWMWVRAGAPAIVQSYWDPVDRFRYPESDAGYSAEIRALLEDSVNLRLRSDVRLGAHLSGGLDSSAVVALMSSLSENRVSTFSGAFREGGEYDERFWINSVVDRYRTDHHVVEPAADRLPALLPKMVWHMDEPAAGPGLFPQYEVCRITADSGVKVVNGGQGGDELFGGYPKYFKRYLDDPRHSAPHEYGVGATLGRLAKRPTYIRQSLSLRRLRSVLGRAGMRNSDPFHENLRLHLNGYRPQLPNAVVDPLANEMYNDLRLYLPALLHVEDRVSMAFSIESRTPLLDYRLVELASQIPIWQKMQGGRLKQLFRTSVADLLPQEVVARRDKRGFPTPLGPWFRGELKDWVARIALDREFLRLQVFSEAYIRTLLRIHATGIVDVSGALWKILLTATWFTRFEVEPSW